MWGIGIALVIATIITFWTGNSNKGANFFVRWLPKVTQPLTNTVVKIIGGVTEKTLPQ